MSAVRNDLNLAVTRVFDAPVALVDLVPTLLAIADAPAMMRAARICRGVGPRQSRDTLHASAASASHGT